MSSGGDDLLARLAAQARRAHDYYAPTVDPAASFAARREVQRFVREHLDDIRSAAARPLPGADAGSFGPFPVFAYWADGEEAAPPLVRACLEQLRRVHPETHVLDAAAAEAAVRLPAAALAGIGDRPAHRSDLLRVALLERFGGMWIDATAYVPAPIGDAVEAALDAGVLVERWSPERIANWFIAARAGNPLVALLRAALEAWWRSTDRLPDYFLFHRVFESLLAEAPEAAAIWRRVPFWSAVPSHLLQLAMLRPYDPAEVRAILAAAPLQKLSYKYDARDVPPGSTLARLIGPGLGDGAATA